MKCTLLLYRIARKAARLQPERMKGLALASAESLLRLLFARSGARMPDRTLGAFTNVNPVWASHGQSFPWV